MLPMPQAQGELQSELRPLKGHLQTMKLREMETSVFLLRNGLEFYLSHPCSVYRLGSCTRKQFMQSTCEDASAISCVLGPSVLVDSCTWKMAASVFLSLGDSFPFQIPTAETYALVIKVVAVPLFALNSPCFLVLSLFWDKFRLPFYECIQLNTLMWQMLLFVCGEDRSTSSNEWLHALPIKFVTMHTVIMQMENKCVNSRFI